MEAVHRPAVRHSPRWPDRDRRVVAGRSDDGTRVSADRASRAATRAIISADVGARPSENLSPFPTISLGIATLAALPGAGW